MEKDLISREECIKNIRQECFHFANLYYHFAKVLIDELGREKGKGLIAKAVKNFAIERGLNLRKRVAELGLEPTPENFMKVTDIPIIAWVRTHEGFYCPYGDAWNKKRDLGREVGLIYCEMNDSTIYETYNPQWKQMKITKHVLWGDDFCESITEYKGKKFELETAKQS